MSDFLTVTLKERPYSNKIGVYLVFVGNSGVSDYGDKFVLAKSYNYYTFG